MGRKLSGGKVVRNIFYIIAIIWGILLPIYLIFTLFVPLSWNVWFPGMEVPYVLGGLLIRADWHSLVAYSAESGDFNAVPVIVFFKVVLVIPYLIFIVSFFSALRCWKMRRSDSVSASNTGMILGLMNLNPWLVIGGFINHRVYIANNKYIPTKERRLG